MISMTDFGDKDTIRLRIGDQKLDSSIVVEESETKQDSPKPPGIKYSPNPWESSLGMWNKIFLVSCVIGVLIDPLFLYIPVINEENKCLRRDEKMMNVAIVIRSITDLAYILQMAVRFGSASEMAKKLRSSIWMRLPWSYLLIDILAILPLPQVIFHNFFRMVAGSKSLIARKFLNFFLLAQYVPRILRIYLSAKDLGRTFDSLTLRLWVRVVFNIFLYIIAGHVFGALWYFHSILSETNCWHNACKRSTNGECETYDPSCYGDIKSNETKNLQYLNAQCSVNPPDNEKHFGIFAKAIESHILVTYDFPKKFSKCFWWGLRNLSSFGQNLDTSSNFWENLFAVLISILGLLLFLYCIGNVQTYMQLATTKAEEARQKISAKEKEIRSHLLTHGFPKSKEDVIIRYIQRITREGNELDVNRLLSLLGPVERNTDLEKHENVAEFVIKTVNTKKLEKNTTYPSTELYKWISDNGIPNNVKLKIMQHMRLGLRLQEGKDVDVVNILGALPDSLVQFVTKHLCLDTLKKVPMIKTKYGLRYDIICKYLKPVTYSEDTYIIRKGEPLDMMLFITQGIVWSFNETSMQRLQKGDYFGNELLEWELENSKSFSTVPRSCKNVKAHTKVEAFALKAADLEQAFKD